MIQDPIDTSKLTGSLERNVMVKYSSDSKILSSKMEMSVQVVEPSCDPALKVLPVIMYSRRFYTHLWQPSLFWDAGTVATYTQ